MKANHTNAVKLFGKIVEQIEERQKDLLGDLWSPSDELIRMIDKKKAVGTHKELYDNGALLVMELTYDSDSTMNFQEIYFHKEMESNPKLTLLI